MARSVGAGRWRNLTYRKAKMKQTSNQKLYKAKNDGMTSLKLLKEYLKTTINLEFYIQRKCPSEVKTFSNKQNLREFINSKLEL